MTTSNADLPAMPQSISQTLDSGYISSSDFVGGMGLSKREHFAIESLGTVDKDGENMTNEQAKQLIGLSSEDEWVFPGHWLELKAKLAVMQADALLAELEKQP